MTNEITDKTMVLITRMGDFWVTPAQAENIMATRQNEPAASIEIEGNTINLSGIDGALTPQKYEELNMKRRGGWQCKFQHWHERHQQCAHHLVRSQA